MTAEILVKKGATSYTDIEDVEINKTIGESNSIGSFEFSIPNHNGRNKNIFSISDELTFFSDLDTYPPTTKIFAGLVNEITFESRENTEQVIIKGNDFMSLLRDKKIEPTSYSNQTITQIITDFMTNELPEITLNNLAVITTVIENKRYNHESVFDALREFAGDNYFFYIDNDKDLHFDLKNSIASGVTLDKTNVTQAKFRSIDRNLANKVFVYGDRVLTGLKESFTANGGSEYSLTYPPHNTTVFVGGSTTPKVGGVDQFQTGDVGSPTQYLVNFNDKKIIFISGTDAGDNIPISGTDAIEVDYQRNRQIIKYGQDDASIARYGPKEKVIIDKGITAPSEAKFALLNELKQNSSEIIEGNINVNNIIDITPGTSITVNLPNLNQENIDYQILEVNYKFNKTTRKSNNVLKVKLNKRIIDINDTIKQLKIDVKKLQSENIVNSEIINRLFYSIGSFGFRVKEWNVKTRSIGDSFVLGHPVNGVLGSPVVGTSGGQVVLGSATAGTFSVQRSGGTF